MPFFETREEKERREAYDSLMYICGPIVGVFFVLALILSIFVYLGDILYYPVPQTIPFTAEYHVESMLREACGNKYFSHTYSREFGFLKSGSTRYRMVRNVTKIADKKYFAAIFLLTDKMPLMQQKYEQVLNIWKEDKWLRNNVDELLIHSSYYYITLKQKDFNKPSSTPLFKYLIANGRFIATPSLYGKLNSDNSYVADSAKGGLNTMKTSLLEVKASLPPKWETKPMNEESLNIKKKLDITTEDFYTPGLLLLGALFIYSRVKASLRKQRDNNQDIY